MNARLRKLAGDLGETFWLVPASLVLGGVLLAVFLLALDRTGRVPRTLVEGPWLYDGGGTGARTLLGAVASSTIGVAGTVFSITIASLSLAAGQMGPRLLRNFVRDRGNQCTLGVFLGTFSYALTVLRSVRTRTEGEFVPHLSMSVGILLAFVCVGTLVFFVGHIAERINVDTVIELVGEDVRSAIGRLTTSDRPATGPSHAFGENVVAVADPRRGYVQEFDVDQLADRDAVIELLARPGDFVFPGAAIAMIEPPLEDAGDAVRRAVALGGRRISRQDLEFAVRQLVEIAVRALSPGINDPHTAIGVLDRLGASLCDMAGRFLPDGHVARNGRTALIFPAITYDGLVDAMFHMIRQNAAGSAAVLIRIVEVLTAVAGCDRDPERAATLRRHADLALDDGRRDIGTPADLEALRERHRRFQAVQAEGPLADARRDR